MYHPPSPGARDVPARSNIQSTIRLGMANRTVQDGNRTDTLKDLPSKTFIFCTFDRKTMHETSDLPGAGRIQPQDQPVFTGNRTDVRIKCTISHPPRPSVHLLPIPSSNRKSKMTIPHGCARIPHGYF